ncbi:hypothetical protein LRS06_13570 [Hymenobacter sp. J193]|uniref:hypothetical protein n=1 Tax=Hymenobacter sp. J193 TaxID=2898429 RepID=UPI002150A818|nr:hypothetical protein [Hymenobacter sp. J193]MCR5888778.1 hypothetical protein [Hymenobacter sp. J193]
MLLLLLVPRAGYEGDVDCWTRWATFIYENGLPNVYELPDNNYNPFYHYVLWLYGKMMGSTGKIFHFRHYLKAFTLLFDFAGAILVSRFVAGAERRFILSLLLLFNIGYLYNTLVWEQVDAIFTFFALAAVVAALRRRTIASTLLYVLALNAKTQAIIFLPLLLLLWLPQWLSTGRRQVLPALGAAAGLQALLLFPFLVLARQDAWPHIVNLNLHAADMYPFITMNAYNLWVLIHPDGPFHFVSDWHDTTVGAAGLTYRQWGMVCFMAALAIGLVPVALLSVRTFLSRQLPASSREQAIIFLTGTLIPLLFTYFNTQMHERYWHSALLFLAAYSFLTRRYVLFVLLSFTYFLQLETMLHFLQLKNYKILFFHPWFLTGMFTLIMVGAYVSLYRLARPARLWAEVRQHLRPACASPSLQSV